MLMSELQQELDAQVQAKKIRLARSLEISRDEFSSGKCIDCGVHVSVDLITYQEKDTKVFWTDRQRSACDCE